eukprot:2113368-Lingulodinium_polyedra.AAC.1
MLKMTNNLECQVCRWKSDACIHENHRLRVHRVPLTEKALESAAAWRVACLWEKVPRQGVLVSLQMAGYSAWNSGFPTFSLAKYSAAPALIFSNHAEPSQGP